MRTCPYTPPSRTSGLFVAALHAGRGPVWRCAGRVRIGPASSALRSGLTPPIRPAHIPSDSIAGLQSLYPLQGARGLPMRVRAAWRTAPPVINSRLVALRRRDSVRRNGAEKSRPARRCSADGLQLRRDSSSRCPTGSGRNRIPRRRPGRAVARVPDIVVGVGLVRPQSAPPRSVQAPVIFTATLS